MNIQKPPGGQRHPPGTCQECDNAATEAETIIICPDCKGERRWPGGALCKTCGGNGQITAAVEMGKYKSRQPGDPLFDGAEESALAEAAEMREQLQTNVEIAREFCRESVQRSFALTDERTEEYAKVIAELLDYACTATIERCAQELEKAYAECATLNLLHGAARLRAMRNEP